MLGPDSYTALFTPDGDGEVTVQITADKAFDMSGNGNRPTDFFKRVFDGIGPAVTLSTSATDPTKAPFSVLVQFSEPVVGLEAGDLIISNGEASQLQQEDELSYTALITPETSGVVTVALPAGVAHDQATNGNQASNELRLQYDADQPAVALSTNAPDLINQAFTVTIKFSEVVNGFELRDLVVSNGVAEDLSAVSDVEYTATIRPAQDGRVRVQVPANKVEDAATNGNTASDLVEVSYDATAPTGYAVKFIPELVDAENQEQVRLEVSGAELGASYNYSISSTGGGEEVSGAGTAEAATFTVPDLDLSALGDGVLTVRLYLVDEAGNRGQEVTHQVEKLTKKVVAIAALADITVPFGTVFSEVPLPAEVEVAYADGVEEFVPVIWSAGNYDATAPATYTLAGTLQLPENASNTDDLRAGVRVTVAKNQPPAALQLSQTTFSPDTKPNDVIGAFSTTDPDDTVFTYALVPGQGDSDNALFDIRNSNKLHLKSNKALSGATSFTIRVRSTDPYQNSIEETFTLTKSAYQPKAGKIKLVNAFSPDGDGVNDTWTVPELRFYNDVEIEVFDRSGVRLYHSSDPEAGWDGRGKDGEVVKGAHFYIIQIKDIDVVQKGVLTVLK
ncbi:Ig-like domain-containing protein [Pontibacter ummariensis]|uniref:Ig-like domain-containing protein n=1 Tax=Pontibacter ummariensis TaxID=1610492 RepID=UPI001FEAEA4A|nr:Ig-like domain-containing protein [Pontibacter ummariensis]